MATSGCLDASSNLDHLVYIEVAGLRIATLAMNVVLARMLVLLVRLDSFLREAFFEALGKVLTLLPILDIAFKFVPRVLVGLTERRKHLHGQPSLLLLVLHSLCRQEEKILQQLLKALRVALTVAVRAQEKQNLQQD